MIIVCEPVKRASSMHTQMAVHHGLLPQPSYNATLEVSKAASIGFLSIV